MKRNNNKTLWNLIKTLMGTQLLRQTVPFRQSINFEIFFKDDKCTILLLRILMEGLGLNMNIEIKKLEICASGSRLKVL
jgi:hypothetical protein